MSTQPKANRKTDIFFRRTADLFAVAGGLGLLVLLVVTVISVFWRYVLRDPIFGTQDITTMSLTVVVAAGVAYGAVHGAHISVHIIGNFFGRGVTRLTDAIVRIAGAGICGFAAWGLVMKGLCGLPCGAITQNLNVPHAPFYYILAAAMSFFGALLLAQLIVGIAHWPGEDPNEEQG